VLSQVKTPEPVVALSTRITLRVLFVIRAAYCGYGIAVVLMNANRYARPAIALAAIALVVSVSLLLGIVISRRRAIPLAVCAADACTAVLALILLALALTPNERTGSLNWALASCVGCAVWLAFGQEWLVRLVLSISLGIAYVASVLAGADLGVVGLAIVAANFVSPPLFYGVALVVMKLVRRIAEQTDAARAIERRLHGEAAALREQERLFRELHDPSLDALEMIADASAHELAAKGRARTAARSLRRSLSGKVRSAAQTIGYRQAAAWS
jgi:signal transduction histidine kinase